MGAAFPGGILADLRPVWWDVWCSAEELFWLEAHLNLASWCCWCWCCWYWGAPVAMGCIKYWLMLDIECWCCCLEWERCVGA